jgi:hypothetical protein
VSTSREPAAVAAGRLIRDPEAAGALTTIEAARALSVPQLAAEYRRQARIYRRNGGVPIDMGEPETPEQAAAWAAKVAMWCIWYHLGEESGRRELAAALRDEHWALYMIDGLRQDQAAAGIGRPEEMSYEVAQLRRTRGVIRSALASVT